MIKIIDKIKYKPKRNREIILDRMNEVANLYFYKRKSIREISKELNWDTRTIWADLQKIKKSFRENIVSVDTNNILIDVMFSRLKIERQLAEIKDKLEKTIFPLEVQSLKQQMLTLKTLDEVKKGTIKDLQELGFIEKPKERHEIDTKNELLDKLNLVIKGDYETDRKRVRTEK